MPRTGRERFLSFAGIGILVVYGLILIYFSGTILILQTPVIVSIFIVLTCCSFFHLFGYNQLMVNGLLNKMDKNIPDSQLQCKNCGFKMDRIQPNCPQCGTTIS